MVRLRNITVRLGEMTVLEDVSLDIPEGRSTVIVGPSGCGKSTLLKVAGGILIPDEGEVLWNDRNLHRLGHRDLLEMRRMNGFAFQDAALWANKSLAENLALPLRVHDPRATQAHVNAIVERACREVGFHDSLSTRPAQLSIGEQKIVSFLRAIIREPQLLFLDEPTASVDHTVEDRMLTVFRRLKERATTMVVVTHSSKLASLVADNVAVLKGGRLLVSGPTSEVVRTRDPQILEILSEILTQAATYDRDLLDLLDDTN